MAVRGPERFPGRVCSYGACLLLLAGLSRHNSKGVATSGDECREYTRLQRLDGSVVEVIGPSLTVGALAQVLRDAGLVEGMQLDINKNWTSYITYTHDQNGTTAKKLMDDEVAAADRYLQASSRDFVAVMPRRHG